jgi:hypothetical protein
MLDIFEDSFLPIANKSSGLGAYHNIMCRPTVQHLLSSTMITTELHISFAWCQRMSCGISKPIPRIPIYQVDGSWSHPKISGPSSTCCHQALLLPATTTGTKVVGGRPNNSMTLGMLFLSEVQVDTKQRIIR